MSLSTVANAHECKGTPTPEDYARLDAALNTIFNRKESSMENVNRQEPINVEEIEATSAEAAKELIKQAGWDIVNALAAQVAEGIQSTALVVLPVTINLEEYKSKLTDPEGFEAKVKTLKADVQTISKATSALFKQHEHRKGEPTKEDYGLVSTLTFGYSKIQSHLETAIHPLMLNIVDELETVGITELTIKETE